MAFFDIDLGERIHRRSIVDRRLATWARYADWREPPPDEASLSRAFDEGLRSIHTRFLDRLTPADVSFQSERLAPRMDDAYLDEVLAAVRERRTSINATDRMGRVETSRGKVYWGIVKASSLSELFKAAVSGRAFKLELWDAGDIFQSFLNAA